MNVIEGEITQEDITAGIAARLNSPYNTCRQCMFAQTLTRLGVDSSWVSFSTVVLPNGDVFQIDPKTSNLIGQFVAGVNNKELSQELIDNAPYKFKLTLRK